MEEVWKDIKGYEGLYQISTLGRIKSLGRYVYYSKGNYNRYYPERILNGSVNNEGYMRITLSKNKVPTTYLIHRLVSDAFIPNPNNLPCINHKDEDKTNNVVSNLEYCTVAYNNTYNNRHKKIAKKLSIPILQYSLDGKFIREWSGTREAARGIGLEKRCESSNITKVLKGKYKYCYGYI